MLSLVLSLAVGGAPLDVAKALNESKRCATQKNDPSTIECSFRLGSGLHIVIAGVGEDLASVSFVKSDAAGDYFAKYQVGVGCILVTTGYDGPVALPGFINPRTGVVYSVAGACRDSVSGVQQRR